VAALIDVTLPVFLLIGMGYLAVWRGGLTDAHVDGIMRFSQGFAIPCLLFLAVARLDLSASFDPALMVSFYTSSVTNFVLAALAARLLFRRPAEDSVAIGFAATFANLLLLGLPITERAYGSAATEANIALIAVHAPFCYTLGIITMETVRNRGGSARQMLAATGRAIFRQPLMLGIGLGFVVNLTGLPLPATIGATLDLLARAALPAALFGLGGVLVRYRPEGDRKVIAMVCALALVVQPAVVWAMSHHVLPLTEAQTRSAVISAAMPPGINAYLFAHMYGRAMRVAASAVLLATALSVLTVTFWLHLLG
jgi:predicted permease